MSDNPTEGAVEKRGKGRLIIALVVVLAAAGGAYFFLFSGGGGDPAEAAPEPPAEVVVDGATMTVALPGDPSHIVRVSFALVLPEDTDTAIIGKRIQILQDEALTTITGYTGEELRTVEGLDRLRSDLTARAQVVYPTGEVLRVVLTEVIVQ